MAFVVVLAGSILVLSCVLHAYVTDVRTVKTLNDRLVICLNFVYQILPYTRERMVHFPREL